jgi:hypothetical protein
VTSDRLRRWAERELAALFVAGHRERVRAFLALDGDVDFSRLPHYVDALRRMAADASRASLHPFDEFLRYLAARTLAFPLDRPKAALPDLVQLCAELATGPWRGSILHSLADLELLRAFHKIDAPGWRTEIVAGVRSLFPKVAEDAGPASELLDVLWRTGYWCGDADLMREGTRLADGRTRLLQYTGSYWQARELGLRGARREAAALLRGMLEARAQLEEHGRSWCHYVEVELASQEAAIGEAEGAAARLAAVRRESGEVHDPMLAWDLERAAADVARVRGDAAAGVAAWRRALAVVGELGTDRLAAEFALALGEAAQRAGDRAALDEARGRLDRILPELRSAAELAPGAERLRLY